MTIFVFNPNKPQPSDLLSNSQGDLLNNNQALDGIFNNDHVQFSNQTADQGYHRHVSMLSETAPAVLPGTNVKGIGYVNSASFPVNELGYFDGTNNWQITPCLAVWAFVNFTVAATIVTIQNSYNITSVVRNGAGIYTVTFTNTLPNANYHVSITGCPPLPGVEAASPRVTAYSTTALQINFTQINTGTTDVGQGSMMIWGK